MRCLDRDRRIVYVARMTGTERVMDGQGRLTGRNAPVYTYPEEFWPTVTPNTGYVRRTFFGADLDYDVTLTIDDPAFDIDEQSVLWLDGLGGVDGGNVDGGCFGGDGADVDGGGFSFETPRTYDHVVRRVARTGNYTFVAASRVEVRP